MLQFECLKSKIQMKFSLCIVSITQQVMKTIVMQRRSFGRLIKPIVPHKDNEPNICIAMIQQKQAVLKITIEST